MATKNEILSDNERIEAKVKEKKTTAQTGEPEFEPIKIGESEDIRARNERDLNLAIEMRMEERQKEREEEERMMELESLEKENKILYEKMDRMLADLNRKTKAKSASEIPLEELGMYLSEEEKPAKDFEEMANRSYDDFKQSEGYYNKIYIDPEGHPTIGIGHLVIHKTDIYDRSKVKWWRDRYKELGLVDNNGKPLTEAQKLKEFDTLVSAMRTGKIVKKGNIIVSPKLSRLPDAEVDKTYRKDFKIHYDKIVKAGFLIHEYPLSVQTSMVHLSFWKGNPGSLVRNIKNKNNVVSVAEGTKKALNASNNIMKKTAQNGVDSLGIALSNYKQNIVIPDGEIAIPDEGAKPKVYAASKDKER